MTQSEKQVTLGAVPDGEAKDALSTFANTDVAGVADGVPKFTHESLYSFKAEHGLVDNNIVIHFFLPEQAKTDTPEARTEWMKYWLERFPEKLDVHARQYFDAEHPRLVVKYTEEMASWYFRGKGYDYLLDAKAYVSKFLSLLDAALQQSN